MLTTYKWATVPIHNTSLDVQHSKNEVTCSHPNLLGDRFLTENSGRLYRVLPMLALTCLVLDPLLQVSLFIGWGLRCRIFWASLSGCSTWPSSAGTWPFFEKLGLWLHLSSLGLVSIGCRCWLHWRTPSWGWWVLSRRGWLLLGHAWDWRVFLLLRFLLWFDRPIKHLATPRAMLP